MKQLPLLQGIDYLAQLPGTKSVRVHWEPPNGLLYIVENDSDAGVPDTASLICAGQPGKFFNLLHQLLTHHVFHKDD